MKKYEKAVFNFKINNKLNSNKFIYAYFYKNGVKYYKSIKNLKFKK